MKVVYASCAMSTASFFATFTDLDRLPGQQVQKYHRLTMAGLAANGVEVVAVTAPPITRSNSDGLLIRIPPDRDGDVQYTFLPILNVPILKNVLVILWCFLTTFRLLRREPDAVVICDVLNFSVATGALFAAKACKRPSVGLVTDLPRYLNKSPGATRIDAVESIMRKYSHYVFLTEEMNAVVNMRGVPYVVIEGQVDTGMAEVANDLAGKHPNLVCLYAGAVDRKYGLQTLVEGFLSASVADSELHIYGPGDYVTELESVSLEHPQVKYFGISPNSLVMEQELKATLLVNPRPTTEDFVRFSFPSKNMEYMASGTPVLTTRLPGMPDAYLPFVYLIEDESATGMAASLKATLSESRTDLHEMGAAAKAFVLEEKGNKAQARRILEMVSGQ